MRDSNDELSLADQMRDHEHADAVDAAAALNQTSPPCIVAPASAHPASALLSPPTMSMQIYVKTQTGQSTGRCAAAVAQLTMLCG